MSLGAIAVLVLCAGAGAAWGTSLLSWQKPPGPIAGRWAVPCPEMSEMSVEITVEGTKAVGRIAQLGRGVARTYREGEEILRLAADDYGDWAGQLHVRGVSGAEHWDSVRFVATPTLLDAPMTTDSCFNHMARIQ